MIADTEEDPSIGTLEFYLKSWGSAATSAIVFKKLKKRQCDEGDFSFESDTVKRDTLFWTIHEKSESYKSYIP